MTDPIRDRLHELTAPPPVGNPVDRVRAREARDGRRRSTIGLVAVVLAVVAIPVGSSALRPEPTPSVAEDTGVVPWALRLATEGVPFTAAEPEPGLPACRADDLTARSEEPVAVPAGEGTPARVTATVLVENTGARCQLPAEASGVLLDGDGVPLPVGAVFRGGPAFSPPAPLEQGASASTELRWSGWCGEDPGRWSLTLTGLEGELRAEPAGDARPVPPCLEQAGDAVYDFGLWTVLNAEGQPAADPQTALVGTVTGPDTVRLGEVLPMVVRLENPTRGPIALDPCPSFAWSVDSRGPGSFLRSSPLLALNCAQAPSAVPTGGHVDFALELVMSPALADGMLAPGEWWVTPGLAGLGPRKVTVLPASDPVPAGPADCTWAVPPDADPRVPGLPPTAAPRTERQAILNTNRGDLTMTLDGTRAPCAVQAFAHHVDGGYWDSQPCYLLSIFRTFRNVDCGSAEYSAKRAGFAFPAEVFVDQSYPAGTVVLTFNESITHAGSIRILFGDAPTYTDNFTILGRITSGLDIVEEVGAGGQKDGDYGGPALPLVIESVELLD